MALPKDRRCPCAADVREHNGSHRCTWRAAQMAKPLGNSKASTPTKSEIDKKWGKSLTAAGWTAIPNVIFERQAALGLTPMDLSIILHLSGFWWRAGDDPYPSKSTLAAAIGVHPRTVQRRIAALETAGFIKRIDRKAKNGGSLSNRYSLDGLIKAAMPFADEHLAERKKRQDDKRARSKRKKPDLSLVKG